MVTVEQVLDMIAEAVITSEHTNISPELVNANQKTIRNGILSIGRQNTEKLVLFQKDVKANVEDLRSSAGSDNLSSIVTAINEFGGTLETIQISISSLENARCKHVCIFSLCNIWFNASSVAQIFEIICIMFKLLLGGSFLGFVSLFVSFLLTNDQLLPSSFLDSSSFCLLPVTIVKRK